MRRVLFVDDEPRILDGLKRMLRPQREEWDMAFAVGGREALAVMEHAKFDVVVSDMRMPDMDGAALLREVARRSPATVRVVLSGFTDADAALRAVPVAHQFLAKPCDPVVLKRLIDRSCSLRAMLAGEELQRLVGGIRALPPTPAIYARLGAALARTDVGANELAGIIEQDPAITAKVLQLVNSSFFGQRREVNSVTHAITLLGTTLVRNLTLVHEVFGPGQGLHSALLDLAAEQSHASAVALVARRLEMPGLDEADVVTSALLHDIGKLVLAAKHANVFATAVTRACGSALPLHLVEYELYGVSHAEVGAYLLGLWGLSDRIVEAVACHHRPDRVTSGDAPSCALAVHVAEALVRAHQRHGVSADIEEMDQALLERLGLIDRLPDWMAATHEELSEGQA
jgi:HD-like signal output (HDOD) protein